MNNIEIEGLKKDIDKYLNIESKTIWGMNERKLLSLKKEIIKLKKKEQEKSTQVLFERNQIEKRINSIFGLNKIKVKIQDKSNNNLPITIDNMKQKNGKPRILFISDVKGWAWWIKSQYLKKYLSDEFDIDIKCVVGEGSVSTNSIIKSNYDFYFTYGFSYIEMLNSIHKMRKATGVTAHRRKNVIFPKMGMAGYQHANSILLLRELQDMGYKDTYYLPNGVDEELFKPINPIKKNGKLVVGHVGKETPMKGQREFILPAIKATNSQSVTNLRTWKNRLPHTEMPKIYNEMDCFVVASIEDGTPNPALEAAACGRPIISNAIGNMPEFIKDGWNGFIVPKKIDAYVEKIKYFKENRNELIRMGNNARKTVEKDWTWKIQSENYRTMFRDIFKK